MTWLNALLAFALAMIVFCTMVSAITEFVQHILARRQQGLEWMLRRFYFEVLRQRVVDLSGSGMSKVSKELEGEEVGPFLRSLTRNLAAPDGLLGRLTRRTELPLEELIERLPETEIGKALLKHADSLGGVANPAAQPQLDSILTYLAKQFGRYEDDATAYFGQRAKSLSVVVAIGLALFLNVDALRLFSTFLTDQELTARFLKEADNLTAQKKVNAPPSDTDAELAALKEQVRSASALGLPVGLRYFPFCISDAPTDPACAITDRAQLNWLWMKWLVATLLAGALIGLGGPFWFDVFSKLSHMMDVFRARDTPTTGTASTAVPPARTAGATPTNLTQRFVAAAQRT